MTKKQAIKKLKNQEDSIGNRIEAHWFLQTVTIVGNIFGKDSAHYEKIKNYEGIDVSQRNYDANFNNLKRLLSACRMDVENGLMIKQEEPIWIKRVWDVLKILLGGIVGYYVAKLTK